MAQSAKQSFKNKKKQRNVTADAPQVAPGMTPMMAQYTEIKAANPDNLLFYRMGDFYELFFEDAEISSRALGIQLTTRGKHMGEDIPMCGVPVHSADDYLQQLIRLGHRVAVCEQMEDPAEAKKRGSKAVVKRDVVRLVTPGTLTEESLLDARQNNFLTSVFRLPSDNTNEAAFALASIDISTGEFLVAGVSRTDLPGELVRLLPGEVVAADTCVNDPAICDAIEQCGAALTPVPTMYFDSHSGEQALKAWLGVKLIEGFGEFTRGELAAIGAVLKYIELTQIGRRPALRPPRKIGPQSVLVIDAATRVNLELTRSVRGEKTGSLLSAIDRTVTGAGARELAARLSSPLIDTNTITARLDAVGYLHEAPELRAELRKELKATPDIARALSRLILGRGGPRDLGAIRDGSAVAIACHKLLRQAEGVMGLPAELATIMAGFEKAEGPLRNALVDALEDELPVQKREGGFVRAGYRQDLDDNRRLRDQSREVLAALQAKYSDATGVKSLKIRHNNVLGYFVEVTATHAATLMAPPHDALFIHRQTLANAVRFTTQELGETESQIIAAADRALAIEQEVFSDLTLQVTERNAELASLSEALAVFDHYGALAELADEQGYVCPKVDDSLAFQIKGGRHPVVEQALGKANQGSFIENDCALESMPENKETGAEAASQRIWIVTGPNMAGKSTFLRQNALIAVLAQMGAFVPAEGAQIGVVDRLFSRVGASDDLARGRSTFMVEMVETAGILNQATDRSLVILDEIGRGTATYDGLSIAWATVEYLHDINQCRSLFATHYHELTALAQKLEHAANATIEVKEWQDDIVFLHKVVPGAADRSYGIQVAKLAGLPLPVISRASDVLQLLERSADKPCADDILEDLPLFAATRPQSHRPQADTQPSPLEDAVKSLNPDELTPRDALDALYKIKALSLDGKKP